MNLLVVDDDIPTAQAVRDCVRRMALPVTEIALAYNVVAAQQLLCEKEIELVVCDIEMPKYSGLQLLEWARKKKMEQAFIFLTCHENFSYAAKAIQYKADAYITKPLNYDALKNALTQAVEKLSYQQELKRRSEYGQLWLNSAQRMENALWRELLFADTAAPPPQGHGMARIDPDKEYQLALCSVLLSKVEECGWDAPTFRYAAGNIVGETFFGEARLARVFDYVRGGRVYIAVAADSGPGNAALCRRLAQACKDHLQCEMTVYLGPPCPAAQLCRQRLFWEQADDDNVTRRIPVVEDAAQLAAQDEPAALDVELLQELFLRGKAVEAVNVVRRALEAAEQNGPISAQTLHSVQQDYLQAAFSCLAREHILAHELFQDQSAKQLEAACKNSVFDMLKWISYVAKKTVDTIAQLRKSETVIERIKRYIEENCCTELSREAVGKYVYLSPGYVAKLFKLETGCSLRDYINERKIERAKLLLRQGRKNISEVAACVGFDNFSYFSTLFKKCAGCTPSEYMRQK